MFRIFEKIQLKKLKRNKDDKYAEYIDTQYERSKNKLSTTAIEKKKYLTSLLSKYVDLPKTSRILVIGCRDSYELDLLEELGAKRVIGIDLFSSDKRICVMDMHAMEFSDNTFDVLYCSHALEHSLEYEKAIDEITRVVKNRGVIVIEVPVNFTPSKFEINDFGEASKILEAFSKSVEISEVYIKENLKNGDVNNFDGTDISRVIFKIVKQ